MHSLNLDVTEGRRTYVSTMYCVLDMTIAQRRRSIHMLKRAKSRYAVYTVRRESGTHFVNLVSLLLFVVEFHNTEQVLANLPDICVVNFLHVDEGCNHICFEKEIDRLNWGVVLQVLRDFLKNLLWVLFVTKGEE